MHTTGQFRLKAAAAEPPHLALAAPPPVRSATVGGLSIHVYRDEQDMGFASALHLAEHQCRLVSANGTASVMLMAAPSALPFYRAYIHLAEACSALRDALAETHFFQFDDYPLPLHHPASFRFLLCKHFFFPLAQYCAPGKVHLLEADAHDPERICSDYGDLIMRLGPDLQLKGTGENGHWGFHEPGMSLDAEPAFLRVRLSKENVAQQMRDHPSLFPAPAMVPSEAFTANVPLFMRTRVLIEDNVPQASKAFALLAAHGSGIVDAAVPSSALKGHPRAVLRTTRASAWALLEYRERGIVSPAMMDRLVESTHQQGVADRDQVRQHMCEVLETMGIRLA